MFPTGIRVESATEQIAMMGEVPTYDTHRPIEIRPDIVVHAFDEVVVDLTGLAATYQYLAYTRFVGANSLLCSQGLIGVLIGANFEHFALQPGAKNVPDRLDGVNCIRVGDVELIKRSCQAKLWLPLRDNQRMAG
jgi:hypothetical protein